MAVCSHVLLVALCACACVCSIASAQAGRRGRVPEGGLTLEYVYGRMRILERKLLRTQQEVTKTQTQVKSLEAKLATGGGQGGGAPVVHKLSDLGPCPVRADGFYYVPQLRSCYRMEPSNMLVNQTEAVRTCKTLSVRSDLISIETAEEQQIFKGFWQQELGIGSLVRFWTSARRDMGKWRWEGSNTKMTNTNWIPSSEHNDDRFSCMGVYSNEAFTWIDVACWAMHLVTCEINL